MALAEQPADGEEREMVGGDVGHAGERGDEDEGLGAVAEGLRDLRRERGPDGFAQQADPAAARGGKILGGGDGRGGDAAFRGRARAGAVAGVFQEEDGGPGVWIDNLRIENDTLRAKIDQLEEDTKAVILAANSGAQPKDEALWQTIANGMITPAHIAQPAPSVPEDVMRDAERYRYLRARDDGTAGVGCWIEADGRVCDRGWLYGVQLDSAIDSFIEVLAAAPKPEARP